MADWNERQQDVRQPPGYAGQVQSNATYDEGLRKHMLSIYNYMASGVLLTGIVAMIFAGSGWAASIMMGGGMLSLIIMFSPLAFVLAMSFGANKFSAGTLQVLFWSYAVAMGLSLSTIFLKYTGQSIALTFFATAGAFAGLSLYGYTTKKDISGWGSFLIMGVIGLIIASLLNAFLIDSSGLELAISALGVLIFSGLTAYDTQRLKTEYQHLRGHAEWAKKAVILGALSLYLNFINMFLFLLRFLGSNE